MTTLDERPPPAPSRRSVVRAGVWTTPVVAVATAAPAFAASPCPAVTLSWDGFADNTAFTSTVVGGVTVTLTLSGATGATGNGRVSSTVTGGQSKVLRLRDVNGVIGTAVTARFSFSAVVQSLSLSLLDIDSATASWADQVVVSTGGYTSALGSSVAGTGTSGTPFRAANANTQVGGASAAGNVALSWAAGVTEVVLVYSQSLAATGSPFIGISDLSFRPVLC